MVHLVPINHICCLQNVASFFVFVCYACKCENTPKKILDSMIRLWSPFVHWKTLTKHTFFGQENKILVTNLKLRNVQAVFF
jgi:hypothetical protein